LERRLDIEFLQNQLDTQFFGLGDRLLYVPVVESTNTLAMQLAQERSEEGVVVLTDNQTAGKGRLGRRWVDVPGCNVLSSTLLRPLFPPYLLVMLASLAVVEAIERTCGLQAAIKWPNDVLIRGRKVCGILIETSHNRNGQLVAALGIGVNVNGRFPSTSVTYPEGKAEAGIEPVQREMSSLGATATTLEMECGHEVSREAFIAHLLHSLEEGYLALQQEAMNPDAPAHDSAARMMWERWRSHLITLGRTVQVQQGSTVISGVAEDVNDDGELLLRRHSGELVNITWGDISMISAG
jgi:BirA family transcriptional regulator, biotin operon repressor / biotin---[acetyl-CoA-carboxylase] ligase